MKSVFVTGDFVLDQYLTKDDRLASSYVDPMRKAVSDLKAGGAWYLADMVRLACDAIAKTYFPAPADLPTTQIVHAHSVWTHFARSKDNPKEFVMRIGEFLGCELAVEELDGTSINLISGAGLRKRIDLLVLEDLLLGFSEDPRRWHKATRGKSTTPILLKLNARPEPNALWNQLVEQHADRLTVVVSINSLRARGAAVSFGLSWDQTIEDLAREFESGRSAYDLARCRRTIVYFPDGSGAASFTRCEATNSLSAQNGHTDARDEELRPLATLERFLYLPDEVEGVWRAQLDGKMFGIGSLVTAAVSRYMLDPDNYPLYIALGRALAAGRDFLEAGRFQVQSEFEKAVSDRLHFTRRIDTVDLSKKNDDPAFAYCTAYPHGILDHEVLKSQPATRSDLLRDVAGPTVNYMKEKAFNVVMQGPKTALRAVPKARYGKYVTVDREEIERINAVRSLINEYRSNGEDKRPLSIAVFGQPGSGKSFAIKELGESLFGDKNPVLEFNLSQFTSGDMHQLHQAFHRVRDACIKGAIPLVFWDEFDTDSLSWLKHFLAPMQDKEFRSGSDVHAFGKAIFVFAGGTKPTFAEFDVSESTDDDKRNSFRDRKGPDFVSRLRGHIDIKGPNPVGAPDDDPAYVIRRAMILRSTLEQGYKRLIDPATKHVRMDAAIIHAFLNAGRFLHGARSMQAVLSMSRLQGATSFEVARLNTPSLLAAHVSGDFFTHLHKAAVAAPIWQQVLRPLAERLHEDWRNDRTAQGWVYGDTRDDKGKKHPLLKPFGQLTSDEQDRSLAVVRDVPAKLAEIGYVVQHHVPLASCKDEQVSVPDQMQLARNEHDRWLRERLIIGYEFGIPTNEHLRRHYDIVTYDELGRDEKQLDNALGGALQEVLKQHRLQLAKIPR